MPIVVLSLMRKLFTPSGAFLSLFALVLLFFVFASSDTLLGGLGFETKANLKGELSRTQEELKQLAAINEDLNNKLKAVIEEHRLQMETIAKLQEENRAIQEKLEAITKKYTEVKTKTNRRISKKTVVSKDTMTIPIQELTELSNNNIEALNSAYKELFKD